MRTATFICTAAALAVILGTSTTARERQVSTQDLEARVAILQKKVETLEAERDKSLAVTAEHDSRLAALENYRNAAKAATAAFAAPLADSRAKGFLMAGPNPAAKLALLEGLEAFQRAMATAAAEPTGEKKEEVDTSSNPNRKTGRFVRDQ